MSGKTFVMSRAKGRSNRTISQAEYFKEKYINIFYLLLQQRINSPNGRIPIHSCSDGKGPQPTAGHPAGLRRAAGMPGGGLALARVLLAEGGADFQRIRQRLHRQPGVWLAGTRNAARRVSWGIPRGWPDISVQHSTSPYP